MATGKVIGDAVQYRLDAPIASGAFSTVYRCTELSSGQTYAMKVVDKRVATRNKMTEALIREVNALEIAGNSPYVTGLVDKMVSKHNYYLVMDLAEGGTLLDLIREQRQELKQLQASLHSSKSLLDSVQLSAMPFMQYERVQHFFKQLLLALHTLHDRNVVHRDVKAENILLNKRRTRLVLSDFGFACHCLPGTELHRACGTLKYCAPELLREYPSYDGRKVDVWAAGVTLYVMLFGGFPYRCSRGDPDALLEVIETTAYRLPRPIPAPIEDILRHMLCLDATQRWSVKQLLQHPWMSGLELRSPSVRSATSVRHFSGDALSLTATGAVDAAEVVADMLSEDHPPVDALPSDEDDVDDGFYQGSEHEPLNSSVSSGPNRSTTSTQQPVARASHTGSRLSHREVISLPVSTPSTPLHHGVAAAPHGGLEAWGTHAADGGTTSPSAAPGFSRQSTKQEILQHGTVSTSMTSIESSIASDDEREEDEEDGDSADDTHYWDEVREGVAGRGGGGTSMSSSLSTGTSCGSGVSLGGWRGRYSYGVWLTARMAAHLISFIAVCVIAVALRVVFKRDIIDLPLPESIRDYVSFLLATPLRRPRAHLTDAAAARSASPTGEASSALTASTSTSASPSASPLSLLRSDDRGGSGAHLHLMTPPIPGAGLRRYVRTADQLMRDSFVGSVVMSHNASLADFARRRTGTPLPGELSEDHSLSSSPGAPSLATAAPSLATVVPTRSSVTRHTATNGERAALPLPLPLPLPVSAERHRRKARRASSPAAGADGGDDNDADAHREGERPARDSALRKERRRQQSSRPPLVSLVDPVAAEVAGPSTLHGSVTAKTPLRSEGQPVDSQEGATDDTGSGDSVLDRPIYSPHHHFMFSPIGPMPTAPEGHQRGMEDFPVAATTVQHA
ncbi:protein kinase [Novymonas esmeraldas]|uniref:Protein kinase n=1 Tax=Novymonas esmeraldas TaxID=1808958 RepID=A0AAW0EVQ1_9TRYP